MPNTTKEQSVEVQPNPISELSKLLKKEIAAMYPKFQQVQTSFYHGPR